MSKWAKAKAKHDRSQQAHRCVWEKVLPRARLVVCKVIEQIDGLQLELAENDVNLVPASLSPAHVPSAVARRKKLYETIHPETLYGGFHGNQHGSRRSGDNKIYCGNGVNDGSRRTINSEGRYQRQEGAFPVLFASSWRWVHLGGFAEKDARER